MKSSYRGNFTRINLFEAQFFLFARDVAQHESNRLQKTEEEIISCSFVCLFTYLMYLFVYSFIDRVLFRAMENFHFCFSTGICYSFNISY